MRGFQWVAWGVTVVSVVGCGQKPTVPTGAERPPVAMSVPGSTGETASADAAGLPRKLNQSFADAVTEGSPGNQQLPPDRTMSGKPTGPLRVEVQKLWDTVKYTSASGKAIVYVATVTTDAGTFKVQMLPEIAPNHARNFICLAKAGYYDGLVFEHLIQQQGDENSTLELVEGGCPLGTGEPGIGHLGYWMKPEFDEAVKHELGSFGAFHDDEPTSAACRFYVALTKAPAMDGNFTVFGKVVAGLDIVRTISKTPRAAGSFAPEKPVTIRSVTIETQEVR